MSEAEISNLWGNLVNNWNSNVSGKSESRWKNIPSKITTSTISELFKTLNFSSSLITVLLVALLILPSLCQERSGIGLRG